jgi:hypothetical protein
LSPTGEVVLARHPANADKSAAKNMELNIFFILLNVSPSQRNNNNKLLTKIQSSNHSQVSSKPCQNELPSWLVRLG